MKHPDKDVIFISKNCKQLTVDELIINLDKLLAESVPLDLDRHTAVNQESLVGKWIRHKWNNAEGDEQWYTGLILSVVDGSTEWFNVQYDGEEDILTLNLYEDIEKGDLDIITWILCNIYYYNTIFSVLCLLFLVIVINNNEVYYGQDGLTIKT